MAFLLSGGVGNLYEVAEGPSHLRTISGAVVWPGSGGKNMFLPRAKPGQRRRTERSITECVQRLLSRRGSGVRIPSPAPIDAS